MQQHGIVLLLDKYAEAELELGWLAQLEVDFARSSWNSCYKAAVSMQRDIKKRECPPVEAPTPEQEGFPKTLDMDAMAQAILSARFLDPNQTYRFFGGKDEKFLEAHISHQLVSSMIRTDVFRKNGLSVETIWEGATKTHGMNNCDAVAALDVKDESLVPFLLMELEREDRTDDRHKDIVKLPVGMKQLLAPLVKSFKERGVANSEIVKLRMFGALIDRRSVKFCVMRPVIFEDNSVIYSVRYLEHSIALFDRECKFVPNITIPGLHTYFETVLSMAEHSQNTVDEILSSVDRVTVPNTDASSLREVPESKNKNKSRPDSTPAKERRKDIEPRVFGGDVSSNLLSTATLVGQFLTARNLRTEGKLLHGISLNAAVSVMCLSRQQVLISKCNGRGYSEVEALKRLTSQSDLLGMVDFPCVELFDCQCFPSSGGYVMIQEHLVVADPDKSKSLRLIALEYTRDIIKSLTSLHVCGIVHRDIAPRHIMYSQRHKRWVLFDFDCCSFVSFHKPKLFSENVGTDGFIAPEVLQVSEHGYDCSVDVWSFGQVLKHNVSVDGVWGSDSRFKSEASSATWSEIHEVSECFLHSKYNLQDSLQQVQTCIATLLSPQRRALPDKENRVGENELYLTQEDNSKHMLATAQIREARPPLRYRSSQGRRIP
jgi:hypothetical protein